MGILLLSAKLILTWPLLEDTSHYIVATDRGEHETQFIQNTGTLPEGPDSRIHTLYIKSLILRSNYNGLYLVKKTNCKRFWITFKHWIKRNINFKHWSSDMKLGFVGWLNMIFLGTSWLISNILIQIACLLCTYSNNNNLGTSFRTWRYLNSLNSVSAPSHKLPTYSYYRHTQHTRKAILTLFPLSTQHILSKYAK